MRTIPALALSALVLLLSLPLLGPASAQETSEPIESTADLLGGDLSPEEQNERAASLLARIHEQMDAALRYQGMLESATAEDSLVLRRQLSTQQVQALHTLHELADALLGLEQSEPQPELRESVEHAFTRVTPRLWIHIDDLRHQIDELRARRPAAAPENRLALEGEISKLTDRLDIVYEASQIHLEKMEALGRDTSEAQATFSQALRDRVDEVSGRIDLALERMDDLERRHKDTPDDATIPVLLVAVKKSLDTNAASMESVLELMDTHEIPTEVYRAQLVTATRDIATGILDRDVAVSLVSRWAGRLKDWVVHHGPQFLIKLLLFLGILFLFRILARLTRKGLEKSLKASKLDLSRLLRRMIVNSAANLVLALGLLVALSQLGISLAPLLAGLGVAGFILGFALQDSLSNFAAGLMILMYRPYDVGDLVDVGGVFGKVNKMSLVSTTILTVDNQTLVVPNSKIWGDVIKNVTAQTVRRIDMVFGISYTDDIPKAEKVLEEILNGHERVLDDPEPVVRLHTLGESSVDFVVRPWVKTDDYWDVYWDVTRAVKMRFDEEEISIPFPQRDVHIYEEQLAKKEGDGSGEGLDFDSAALRDDATPSIELQEDASDDL